MVTLSTSREDIEGVTQPSDGSVVLLRASQVLGQLIGQTEVSEDMEARPTGDLSENLSVLPMWQLRSMLDEQMTVAREIARLQLRMNLVDAMIREAATGLAAYDPSFAVGVPQGLSDADREAKRATERETMLASFNTRGR